jgi:hypothetical protein
MKIYKDLSEKEIILDDEEKINLEYNHTEKQDYDLNIKNKISNEAYKRIYANSQKIPFGKYDFRYIAPKKNSDVGSFYSYLAKYSIPNDYIRVAFCLKLSETEDKARVHSISAQTWEASNGKYITVYPWKVKEDYEEEQQSIMNDIADLIKKKLYKHAQITVLPVEEDEDETEATND